MKRSILISAFLAINAFAFAKESPSLDSVGIEKINGQSFIIHKVEEKETLFAISRRYKTPVNDIVQNNEDLKQGLRIGQRIKVPYLEVSAIPTGAKIHNVAPGETLFSIAQMYQVAIKDIMDWNDLKGNDLSVGQALILEGEAVSDADKAPENTPVAVSASNSPESKAKIEPGKKPEKQKPTPTVPTSTQVLTTGGGWITHKVAQGQTLFSIAQQYGAKVEDLKAWNGLSSNTLSLGQSLKVGKDTKSSVPTVISSPAKETVAVKAPSGGSSASSAPKVNTASSSTAYKNIKETGQAEVIDGTGNHKKYLVLHRTAPVGTIMRIRNEANDVTVFARVVGVLPNTGDNNKLIIKVSKAAFDQLKAVNSRFPVEVSY